MYVKEIAEVMIDTVDKLNPEKTWTFPASNVLTHGRSGSTVDTNS